MWLCIWETVRLHCGISKVCITSQKRTVGKSGTYTALSTLRMANRKLFSQRVLRSEHNRLDNCSVCLDNGIAWIHFY
jgi:hypothetical protein